MKSTITTLFVFIILIGMLGCGGGGDAVPEPIAPTSDAPPPGPEPVLDEEGP
jgi:hypothetical protein